MIIYIVSIVIVFTLLILLLLLSLRAARKCRRPRIKGQRIKVCLVLGSGGHTTELLRVVSALDASHYFTRLYVIAECDKLSEIKMNKVEESMTDGHFQVAYVRRARKVHQSYMSSVWTTVYSLVQCAGLLYKFEPDLVLTSGPGTCIPIVMSAFIFDVLRVFDCTVVFIESVCRVKSLSMSAALLYKTGIADKVVVQWPQLQQIYPRTQYLGLL